MKQKKGGNEGSLGLEVSEMLKSDLLTGLFIGVIVGLVFTSQLAPHLAVIVILAVIFGAKMIDIK